MACEMLKKHLCASTHMFMQSLKFITGIDTGKCLCLAQLHASDCAWSVTIIRIFEKSFRHDFDTIPLLLLPQFQFLRVLHSLLHIAQLLMQGRAELQQIPIPGITLDGRVKNLRRKI